MKNKRLYLKHFAYLAFLILLFASLMGCTTKTSPKQMSKQKESQLPVKKYAWNRKVTEKGKGQLSDSPLFVTDHRTNSPTVREYANKKLFLREYGFNGRDPYFEYYTDDGVLQLELYYNEYSGVGCGLQYDPKTDREPDGFLFNGSNNPKYYRDYMGNAETDPYAILSFDNEDKINETLQEQLDRKHCHVSRGNVEYYYIYADEDNVPAYCLIIDHDSTLLCAELLEYHIAESEMYYGRIGPTLAGETENRYAASVREAVETDEHNYENYVTHTYAADYDGDGMEEAFVIFGKEININYKHVIAGDCWFVDSNLDVSLCIGYTEFPMSQEFICQTGKTYFRLRDSMGISWRAGIYTVQNDALVEISGSNADKYIDKQGQVIQIQDAYDGTCYWTDMSKQYGYDAWEYLWSTHSWKPYTFLFDHGKLQEIPSKEVTREEVERIAPLPDAFDEEAPECAKQFILRDNGELNINMAIEIGGIDSIEFRYIIYRLNENNEWQYIDWGMGTYQIHFEGGTSWDYIKEIKQR